MLALLSGLSSFYLELIYIFRFGLAQATLPDEETKKKARLERFAPASKTDPAEEDKRKARALR